MKTPRAIISKSVNRQRARIKRPVWIVSLVACVSIFLVAAYLFPLQRPGSCSFFFSSGCSSTYQKSPRFTSRELTDEEIASQVVIREILSRPLVEPKNPKVAFMFLTLGSLPFEMLWDRFFQGHEGSFTVYVHASKVRPVHVSRHFRGRDIHSEKVEWGRISMVEAEKRLLANALEDTDNLQFVLLSDSCVPLHNFDFIYNYLIYSNMSYIDCFVDPGPHGNGRYSQKMMPEVEKRDFRKGAQWFSIKRQHAIVVMADSLYYNKFKQHCQPGMERGLNCYSDEHYLPTMFNMIDPGGISNWSTTHADWSERKWHPKTYKAQDITYELLKNISSIDESYHVTSDERKIETIDPCLWNGVKRPCYLFARKFDPDTLDNLIHLFPNYTRGTISL